MTIHITYEEALAGLQAAVELKGEDYVYRPLKEDGIFFCSYFDPASGEPSCIVGHVLAQHGYTLEDDLDNKIDGDTSISWWSQGARVLLTPEAEALLTKVQSKQDCGTPWGKAVALAVGEMDRD